MGARQVERARIVLLAASGEPDVNIAARCGITNQKAARWRARFLQFGPAGLEKEFPALTVPFYDRILINRYSPASENSASGDHAAMLGGSSARLPISSNIRELAQ